MALILTPTSTLTLTTDPNPGSTRVAYCCTVVPRWRPRSGNCLRSSRRGSWRCARAARAAASCSRSGATATSASTRPAITSPRPSAFGPPGRSASLRCAGSTSATNPEPEPEPEPYLALTLTLTLSLTLSLTLTADAGSRGTETRRCWPRPPRRDTSSSSMSRRVCSTLCPQAAGRTSMVLARQALPTSRSLTLALTTDPNLDPNPNL